MATKKPKIGKPMATRKTVVNPKPHGPSRTTTTTSDARTCERFDCRHPAVAFRQGQHVCREHTPSGDLNCSHSLGLPCAYCGWPEETS